jgi:hypothetical protein
VLSVPTALTLTTLTKHFGPTIAVDDVNLPPAS